MKRLETFGLIKSQTNQNVSIGESLSKPKSTLNNTSIFDNKLEDLLSILQLAKKLDCSVSYVKKLRQASTILPCVCFGRFVRFKFSDVLAALEKKEPVMTKRFNPKLYLGKKRVELVSNIETGISKIWTWDSAKKEYLPPIRGKQFVAVRKRNNGLNLRKEKATFDTLAEARNWKNSNLAKLVIAPSGDTFESAIKLYKLQHLPKLRSSTVESYEKWLEKYYLPLLPIEMSRINPKDIDNWILWLKRLTIKESRVWFKSEFCLLSGVFRNYGKYNDNFVSPIKDRHREDIVVKAKNKSPVKYISEADFKKFNASFVSLDNGLLFSTLATVQYYETLRISEAAALDWEDLIIDETFKTNSFANVTKSVHFSRFKGKKSYVQKGFKNSKQCGGIKILPLYREVIVALLKFQPDPSKRTGLIFKDVDNHPLSYRQIQYAYNKSFKAAGLQFSSTHILRHGGASLIYNESHSDIDFVKQMTGNRDLKSVQVYAHSNPNALKNHITKRATRND